MADKKISELTAITGSNTAATDVFVVVDTSTGQTKKITREELNNAIEQDVLDSIDIDTINGDFTVNGNINLGDNNKAIFGAGSDLQIYHNGSHSYIDDAGAANLYIRAADNLYLQKYTGETFLQATADGEVRITHNNSTKLATTSTGIDVTGTVTADGLTVDGVVNVTDAILNSGANGSSTIFNEDGTTADFRVESVSNTHMLFVDGGLNRVGIGTSTPTRPLSVTDTTSDGTGGIKLASYLPTFEMDDISGGGTSFILQHDGTSTLFKHNTTERMRLDSSGNLLVGTTTSSTTVSGHSLLGGGGDNGIARHIADGIEALQVGRINSDGVIAKFYKDGSTVGSIGNNGTRPYFASTDCGIRLGAADLLPATSTGVISDNVVNLGSSSGRFKDLHLGGTAHTGLNIHLQDSGTTRGKIELNASDTDDLDIKAVSLGSNMKFFTVDTERMRIDSSGRVGIGTSLPSRELEVTGSGNVYIKVTAPTANDSAGIELANTGATWLIQNDDTSSAALTFDRAGSERMRIDSSGNVGIGTSSPNATLQVEGTDDANNLIVGHNSTDFAVYTDSTVGEIRLKAEDGSGSNFSKYMTFYTHPSGSAATERMRIASDGSVLVGTTSNRPDESNDTGMALYPNGKKYAYSTTDFGVFNTNSTGKKFYFRINSSEKGSISFNTNSVSYTTTSDYRLKENAVDITDGITRVKQLDPKRFNFIGDSTIVDGFIAHEAATVVPEAVTGEKDAVDEDGNPDYQGIDQAKLVPLLTAALQEAITKIEDLEARVATLEGN